MESREEVVLLVKDGSQIIALDTLCFRRWQPWMNCLCKSSLEATRWVAVRVLPIHLWSLRVLKAIGELFRVFFCSSALPLMIWMCIGN